MTGEHEPSAHERSVRSWEAVVGRVVVNAGHLEVHVLDLALALGIPHPGHRGVRSVLDRCQSLLETSTRGTEETRLALLALISRAYPLIRERNSVVHSVYLYKRVGEAEAIPGRLILWDYGTTQATFRPQEIERVERLASGIATWCSDAHHLVDALRA